MTPKKILIVEDEVIIASDMKKKLEEAGHSVIDIATKGEKAIEIALSLKPDLIFMDIMLSGKMDGIEAAKEIHNSSDIPIIFLTAHSEKQLLERAKIAENVNNERRFQPPMFPIIPI